MVQYCVPSGKIFLRDESPRHFHLFIMNESDGNKVFRFLSLNSQIFRQLYGGCLTFQESDKNNGLTAICLLSHFPFFDGMRSFLEGLLTVQAADNPSVSIRQYIKFALSNVNLILSLSRSFV